MEIKDLSHVPKEILERIQKLERLANAAGSEAEAANAMARMNEILVKYNIDLMTAKSYKPEENLVFTQLWDLNPMQGRHDGGYARDLVFCVCRFNFCKAVHEGRARTQYDQGDMRVFGSKVNLQLVEYMVQYIRNQMHILHKAAWKSYHGTEKVNAFRRGFYRGCVNALIQRLAEAQREHTEQTQALMVIGNKLVQEKVQSYYGHGLGKVKTKNLLSQDGKNAGAEAGRTMNLNKGLNSGTSSTLGRLN